MHDIVIRNATVIDGTGAPGFKADVALEGGRIAAIGTALPKAREEIDASGRVVAPASAMPRL